jgi:hypothetical protein
MFVSFRDSSSQFIMKAFCPTFCHSLVSGFSSLGSSSARLALDFIVNVSNEV